MPRTATPSRSTTRTRAGRPSTVMNGLNNKGQIVGFYTDGAGNTDGFLAHQ